MYCESCNEVISWMSQEIFEHLFLCFSGLQGCESYHKDNYQRYILGKLFLDQIQCEDSAVLVVFLAKLL